MSEFKSTCSYCGVGCGIKVCTNGNRSVNVTGDENHPANRGMLCSKGMNLHHTVMDTSDRLKYPMMRWGRSQPLQRVDWDTAISRSAAVFQKIIDRHGPDSVGFYVSGQCLTEEYYLVNKLCKGFLKTNNIDTNSRLCMSSAVVGYKKAFGEDSVPVSYDDIELADTFFITGANPAWCHPILFRRIEAHKEANPDVKIIVADPRKTQSCALADMHLQLKPGTDVVLYNAIGRVLMEKGLIDKEFIDEHTDGFEEFREMVMGRSVAEAAHICDLLPEEIEQAASWIGNAKGFISMWAMGLNQSAIGVNKNLALLNLSLITGKIGKPGSGPFSLTGQPNAMGGREVGGMANLLPAHRDLSNPDHIKEVEDFWNVEGIPDKPGLTATEMFDDLLLGKMKAIWIICTNPVVSLPDARNVEVALRNARFVVVQDISANSETVPYGDVVLPAAGWLEKEGTMTNSDRRITYLEKGIDAPGEALPDAEILMRFAKKMGFEDGFSFSSSAEIFDEHAALTKGTKLDISGLNYEILKKKRSVQWPYPEGAQEETKRLFTDHKFYTPNQRAKIFGIPDANLSEKTSDELPLILTSGRIRDQWHTRTRTGKVQKLKEHLGEAFAEIHPADAEERGIKDGDIVLVKNGRGEVKVKATVTSDIKKGVVFLPMHYGKALNRANNLTNNLVDKISKEPDFKYAAVQVERYQKPVETILIAGAGAAAIQFVRKHRQLNSNDEIKVFSLEENPFYNRVLLPEYISGRKKWDNLQKLEEGEDRELDIELFAGTGIAEIDRLKKEVTDSTGTKHSYDKLILATGSRANKPPNLPSLENIFTLRRKEDADNLLSIADAESKVSIVGGGLLGLELADSLQELGVEVTIIQRSSRLMDRQLDETASELLYEELADKGIKVLFNDEVLHIRGEDKVSGIILKSGKHLDCEALVYAIGTIPNTGIAREAGIKCNRGVVVNEQLQTSDPSIYAIGEIAEFNGSLFGITAAAEEQANLLSENLNGNAGIEYQGTLSMNILKVTGLNLCSLGEINVSDNDDITETIVYYDRKLRLYKKCLVRNDRLIGAILFGEKSEFAAFRELISKGSELGKRRKTLLGFAESAIPVKGRLVCSCNNVGEGNIQEHIDKGCDNVQKLCELSSAGTGCGSCKPEVKQIFERSLEVVNV